MSKKIRSKGWRAADAYGDQVVFRVGDKVRVRDIGGEAVIAGVDELSREFEEPVRNIWVKFLSGDREGEEDYFWSFNLTKV